MLFRGVSARALFLGVWGERRTPALWGVVVDLMGFTCQHLLMPRDNVSRGAAWAIGAVCQWLRDRWVLAGLILVGALAAALPYFDFAQDGSGDTLAWANGVRVAGMVLAALAVAMDRAGDLHSRRATRATELAARRASARAMSPLLSLLESVIDITQARPLTPLASTQLRTLLVTAAQLMPLTEGVRATYYPLRRERDGTRVLDQPTSRGRDEESTTTWFESTSKGHFVWQLMDGADINAMIVRRPLPGETPDRDYGIDWESKVYECFISVPVKTPSQQFGLLSINAPGRNDLTEADRVATIAAARVMGLALSLDPEAPMPKRRSHVAPKA